MSEHRQFAAHAVEHDREGAVGVVFAAHEKRLRADLQQPIACMGGRLNLPVFRPVAEQELLMA